MYSSTLTPQLPNFSIQMIWYFCQKIRASVLEMCSNRNNLISPSFVMKPWLQKIVNNLPAFLEILLNYKMVEGMIYVLKAFTC